MENLFWLVFAGIFVFFAYRMFKYKGLKGAMFGAEIVKTLGRFKVKAKAQSVWR